MKNIFTIFKKELLDTLRDRRTLMVITLIPLLLMPVLINILSLVQKSQSDNSLEKDLKITIETNNNGSELIKYLKLRKDVKIIDNIAPEQYNELIRDDSLDFALVFGVDFDKNIAKGKTAKIDVYQNSSDLLSKNPLYKRLATTIDRYNEQILQTRLDTLGATKAMINPLETKAINVYTQTESMGKTIGGYLPYLFVIFCLMGCMYPVIDLFTGEKERGTIETILTVPVSRIEILTGKMLVASLTGIVSGILTIIGAYLTLMITPDIPELLVSIINEILNPTTVLLIFLMLIPLTFFFSGLMIPMAINAKSFKEAQSSIQPLTFVAIIPLLIATIPTIKLNMITALIPVLNIALASREIIAGTIDYGLLAVVFGSLILFALLGIFVAARWFTQEGNILRR